MTTEQAIRIIQIIEALGVLDWLRSGRSVFRTRDVRWVAREVGRELDARCRWGRSRCGRRLNGGCRCRADGGLGRPIEVAARWAPDRVAAPERRREREDRQPSTPAARQCLQLNQPLHDNTGGAPRRFRGSGIAQTFCPEAAPAVGQRVLCVRSRASCAPGGYSCPNQDTPRLSRSRDALSAESESAHARISSSCADPP